MSLARRVRTRRPGMRSRRATTGVHERAGHAGNQEAAIRKNGEQALCHPPHGVGTGSRLARRGCMHLGAGNPHEPRCLLFAPAFRRHPGFARPDHSVIRITVSKQAGARVRPLLKKRGFRVSIAYDGLQAWSAALQSRPEAIILDIHMPAGTGFEVLRKLKTSPKTSQMIVMSGSVNADEIATIETLGADRFLQKPADLEQLFTALGGLLNLTRGTNEVA